MKAIEDIFTLIKQTVNLSGEINDYQVRLSNGRFERENLIGIYKIRESISIRKENRKLAKQIHELLIGLENYSGVVLKGANIDNNNYIGTFYLSEDWNQVIGYLENDINNSTEI